MSVWEKETLLSPKYHKDEDYDNFYCNVCGKKSNI